MKTYLDESVMTPDALDALEKQGFSRRGFLRSAGALVVGFSLAGSSRKLAAQSTNGNVPLDQVDSWVAIAQDETVTGYSGKCEFGQGFSTVQVQLIAEELYVPMSRVKLIYCDTSITPDQGVTSGSQSHIAEFGPGGLRQALATAREALFRMAAQQFNVTVDNLTVQNGVISLKSDSTRSVTYGQLIGGKRFSLTSSASAVPKDPAQYTVLGTSVPRRDIPAKVTGQFLYVQQVRVPGMRHGKVVRPPIIGAKLLSVDPASVQSMPGNVKVVVKNDFVGVVADKEWQALQAAGALKVTWSQAALPDQGTFFDYMRQQPSRDSYTVVASDVDQQLAQASQVVSATYFHPYQMHGSIGTSCAVADVKGTGASGSATIWGPTQGVYPQRDSVAAVLGIPPANVRVIYTDGSGCYGINGADSVCYDAALMSQAAGTPVRVQYTRRDEMTGAEHYGPATVINLSAGLDDSGQIVAWDCENWSLARGNRPTAAAPGNIIAGALAGFPTPAIVPAAAVPPSSFSNNSNSASAYGAGCAGSTCGGTGLIKSERVLVHTIPSPFYTGPLRSPNRLQNTFANESFIDEVAAAIGADPVQYRLRHLSDSRLMDVLNAAAQAASWETRPSPKPGNAPTGVVTGRGISCVLYEGNNGYAALVAEVQVDQDSGVVTVTRCCASQDSGPISNPDGIRNQMEGGALQGMSRALFEEVTWSDQGVSNISWRRYKVFQFGQPLPQIVTVPINRLNQPQTGAGECIITAVAAAIANAVFDATGARLRQVPFTPSRVLDALAARTTSSSAQPRRKA